MPSMEIRATVLSSSLRSRTSRTWLITLTVGSKARRPATAATRSRSGPGGRAPGRAGQRASPVGTVSRWPPVPVSTSSPMPRGIRPACVTTWCNVSPARYSCQSNVSSHVRRTRLA